MCRHCPLGGDADSRVVPVTTDRHHQSPEVIEPASSRMMYVGFSPRLQERSPGGGEPQPWKCGTHPGGLLERDACSGQGTGTR